MVRKKNSILNEIVDFLTVKKIAYLTLGGMMFVLGGCVKTTVSTVNGDPSTTVEVTNTQGVKIDPNSRANIRYELATGYFEQGKFDIALEEIRQVLQLAPNHAEAYNLQGLIYMSSNDLVNAGNSFQRSLSINSRDPNTLHNYGWLLCKQKSFSSAQAYFSQALVTPGYRESEKTYIAQGICYIQQGNRTAAEQSFLRAFERDPSNPVTIYNLANLLYQRKDYPRAQFYIRKLNNDQYANAESLWLGVRIEHKLGNSVAMQQLMQVLRGRFPTSKFVTLMNQGAFE